MSFEVVRHSPDCGGVLLDAYPFRGGPLRVRCQRCHQRVWVASDGDQVSIVMVDAPPVRVQSSVA